MDQNSPEIEDNKTELVTISKISSRLGMKMVNGKKENELCEEGYLV